MLAISAALNEARLTGLLAFLDTGGPGTVQVFAGIRPTLGGNPESPALVEITLALPAGIVADNVLTLTPTADALVVATGIASWARLVNGAGALAFDCDVSVTGGTGEITLPTLQLFAGGYSRLTSGVLG
jgi:hypothetical protein